MILKEHRINAGTVKFDAVGRTAVLFQAAESTPELESIFKDKGEPNYETSANVAGRIETGELEIRRLNPERERGRIKGGRRNVEATLVLAGNEGACQAASRAASERR